MRALWCDRARVLAGLAAIVAGASVVEGGVGATTGARAARLLLLCLMSCGQAQKSLESILPSLYILQARSGVGASVGL